MFSSTLEGLPDPRGEDVQQRRNRKRRETRRKWASIGTLVVAPTFTPDRRWRRRLAAATTVFPALVLLLLGAATGIASGGDLSQYRNFRLGTDLASVAKQAGVDASEVKLLHRRPALIQELVWRPQLLGPSAQQEAVKEVFFRFYQGDLYQIVVNYDRYETEGLTGGDLVERIASTYGAPSAAVVQTQDSPDGSSDQGETVANWQDAQFQLELIRFSYGPTYRLVAVQKRLDALARAAIVEAGRLDDKEAPAREAQRIADDDETRRAKLEKARLANKEKFKP